MKIEQLIVQYLFTNKSVTLQHIGTFSFATDVVLQDDDNKEVQLPENAIQFTYNPHAEHDEGLIDFIVQTTRKIKPLATSDLDSFIILSREYLNIGKPYIIEGLGALQKTQNGDYQFIQGHLANPKLIIDKPILENITNEISFATPIKKRSNKRAWMIGISSLLLIIVVATSIIYLAGEKQLKKQPVTNPIQDTSVDLLPVHSNPNKKDTILHNTPINDSVYTVAIKRYYTLAAANSKRVQLSRPDQLLSVVTVDSITYLLTMQIKGAIYDSSRVLDSLSRFYGNKVFIVNK